MSAGSGDPRHHAWLYYIWLYSCHKRKQSEANTNAASVVNFKSLRCMAAESASIDLSIS